MQTAKRLGRRIRALREVCGLTQTELGAAAGGVHKQAVAGWESGRSLPTADKLPLIAAALGVDMADLFEPRKAA